MFVDETQRLAAHLHHRSDAKPQQNPTLHPGVYPPSEWNGRIGLGRAKFSRFKCCAKFEKCSQSLSIPDRFCSLGKPVLNRCL
jgi:hypothetical protein